MLIWLCKSRGRTSLLKMSMSFTVWPTALPKYKGEGDSAWIIRVKKKLKTIYERQGYKEIWQMIMARSVEPQTAESGDRLLSVPNPPEHSHTGDTPSSIFVREEEEEGEGEEEEEEEEAQEDTSVKDSELQESEDMEDPEDSDYMPR
ncbi:hypothetical protein INS49_001518 [Diaporthe citri]|uniref:uncharacterized protein n=1 Tax=Diaporthe citri TaxID=83186 RepID=UPI001C822086|nr:uncharacterized protein INS49_001518 [Diaporthe citri]KAG6367331.1 hypothetical protein INS49_001518 [Diaporthe citri]